MSTGFRVFMVGDVVGDPGCRALFALLPDLRKRLRVGFVVANAENANDGKGLTGKQADTLFASGVDVVTSGNHIWQSPSARPLLQSDKRILRPHNYPQGVAGTGLYVGSVGDIGIAVLNLQGRQGMYTIDCPFDTAASALRGLIPRASVALVDFHAESTEEKEALGLFLDGKVTAVAGTHTHVQTADERILPGGTAYVTDLGMTGPVDSVIGVDPREAVRRHLTQLPLKLPVIDAPGAVRGAVIEADPDSGRALSIERVDVAASV
jgi:metallophosphoesterase (TIGR00282 family)